jgi:hypothetical protein
MEIDDDGDEDNRNKENRKCKVPSSPFIANNAHSPCKPRKRGPDKTLEVKQHDCLQCQAYPLGIGCKAPKAHSHKYKYVLPPSVMIHLLSMHQFY